MNSKQIIKRLEADGWALVRVKGSHHQFKHPSRPGLVTVKHPDSDIPAGTLRSIEKQAGWRWRTMRFPVVLHSDDGVRYGVTVPDLPGCFSAGDTFDEALLSVAEAIDLHLEGLTEEGSGIPVLRPIAQHRADPEYADGVWALVEVDVSRFDGRSEKINITLPRNLLARIDAYAKSHGATRSGFLADAARSAMR